MKKILVEKFEDVLVASGRESVLKHLQEVLYVGKYNSPQKIEGVDLDGYLSDLIEKVYGCNKELEKVVTERVTLNGDGFRRGMTVNRDRKVYKEYFTVEGREIDKNEFLNLFKEFILSEIDIKVVGSATIETLMRQYMASKSDALLLELYRACIAIEDEKCGDPERYYSDFFEAEFANFDVSEMIRKNELNPAKAYGGYFRNNIADIIKKNAYNNLKDRGIEEIERFFIEYYEKDGVEYNSYYFENHCRALGLYEESKELLKTVFKGLSKNKANQKAVGEVISSRVANKEEFYSLGLDEIVEFKVVKFYNRSKSFGFTTDNIYMSYDAMHPPKSGDIIVRLSWDDNAKGDYISRFHTIPCR